MTKNAEVTLCAVSKTCAEDREAAAELAKSCTRVAVFPQSLAGCQCDARSQTLILCRWATDRQGRVGRSGIGLGF